MSGGAQQGQQSPMDFNSYLGSVGLGSGRGGAYEDAVAGARVNYDQLVSGGAYGTNFGGVIPGQKMPTDPVMIDGQQWLRSGHSPDQITEQRLQGMLPADAYRYDSTYGDLFRADVGSAMNKKAQAISLEDKANNPWYQKALDSGAGPLLVAGGFMGPVAAAGGLGAGGLGAAGEGLGAFGSSGLTNFGAPLASEAGFVPGSFELGAGSGLSGEGFGGLFGDAAWGVNPMSGDAGGVFADMYNQYAPDFSDGFNIPGGQGELDTFMNGLQGEMLNPAGSNGSFFPSSGSSWLDMLKNGGSVAKNVLGGTGDANTLRNLGLLGGGALGGLSSLLNPTESTQTSTSQTTNTPTATPEAQGFLNSYLSGGPNPYLNQTTQVGSNPYAGQNPYFEDVLKRSMNDVSGRINSQFNGNAWGGSGHQETLSRALADAGTAARMQDYGMQQQLSEADINRRSLYGAGDLNRNAALYSSDMQNKLRAAALGVGGTSSSTTTGPNPYQPSMFGNVVGGGMLGAGLLPWIFGNGSK